VVTVDPDTDLVRLVLEDGWVELLADGVRVAPAELAEVVAGHPEMGISDLDDAENVAERGLADKLLFAYVPLRIEPGGRVVAVAELYQDYAVIQEDIDAFEAALTGAAVEHEVVTYPGAPHSFFDRKQDEFADASVDAWRRVIAFVERYGGQALAS